MIHYKNIDRYKDDKSQMNNDKKKCNPHQTSSHSNPAEPQKLYPPLYHSDCPNSPPPPFPPSQFEVIEFKKLKIKYKYWIIFC